MVKVLAIAVFILWAPLAPAAFFPEDSVKLPKGLKHRPKTSQMKVLEKFQERAERTVEAQGAQLMLVAHWSDQRVNALAARQGEVWEIHVYGGLLAHPELTDDEIILVLCHELGHHLGGAPTASRGGWSACEGQADYWSGQFCAQLLDNPTSAALSLARLYARSAGGWPELETKDPLVVKRTFYGYPSPQCRLDTLLAGFLGRPRPACWFVAEE